MSEQALSGLADAFNEALAEGRLTIQSCNDCGRPNMWPRYRCPFCQSADLGWKEASGDGTLVSYSVVRAVPPKGFEDQLPYALGVIRLEEGVQLLARLESEGEAGFDEYECDAAVRFSPHPAEEMLQRPVAWFRLAPGDGP
jgi:uncharacterized OB-fold protein